MIEQIMADIKFHVNDEAPSQNAQPWMSQHTSSILNPIVRFHNQIIDFSKYVEPSATQHQTKMQLFSQLQTQIKKRIPAATILSPILTNKLYMKQTEINAYVILQQNQQNWQQICMQVAREVAQVIGLKIFNLSVVVTGDQCRIICEHSISHTEIWIHFVPSSWRLFISQMDSSIAMSPQIKYLYLITYCMVRQRSMQTSISSLFIYGLCSFFLYERRKQRVRTLTENVIKFLEFYSISFIQDKERKVTYHEGNTYNFLINNDKFFKFEIADKVDLSTRKVKDLFKVIHNRYRVLGNYYYAPGNSILLHLINPCGGKFFY